MLLSESVSHTSVLEDALGFTPSLQWCEMPFAVIKEII